MGARDKEGGTGTFEREGGGEVDGVAVQDVARYDGHYTKPGREKWTAVEERRVS